MDKSSFKLIEKSHLLAVDRLENFVDLLKSHYDYLKSKGIDEKDLLHYQKYITTINNIADDAFWHLLDFLHDYEKTSQSPANNK